MIRSGAFFILLAFMSCLLGLDSACAKSSKAQPATQAQTYTQQTHDSASHRSGNPEQNDALPLDGCCHSHVAVQTGDNSMTEQMAHVIRMLEMKPDGLNPVALISDLSRPPKA
jgi:hypothetical protein